MSTATKTGRTFRMECVIHIDIHATPARIWALLTDAAGFSRWNSTVSRIDGEIREGSVLSLEVPSAPGRTFKPKVTRLEAARAMEWSDGLSPMFRGVRTFALVANADGTTRFSMAEVLSGLMLPMIKRSLPDFGPVFEAYAADLKRAAEAS